MEEALECGGGDSSSCAAVPPTVGTQQQQGGEKKPSRGVDSCDMPPQFLCPISHDCMSDPVFAGDGHTYGAP